MCRGSCAWTDGRLGMAQPSIPPPPQKPRPCSASSNQAPDGQPAATAHLRQAEMRPLQPPIPPCYTRSSQAPDGQPAVTARLWHAADGAPDVLPLAPPLPHQLQQLRVLVRRPLALLSAQAGVVREGQRKAGAGEAGQYVWIARVPTAPLSSRRALEMRDDAAAPSSPSASSLQLIRQKSPPCQISTHKPTHTPHQTSAQPDSCPHGACAFLPPTQTWRYGAAAWQRSGVAEEGGRSGAQSRVSRASTSDGPATQNSAAVLRAAAAAATRAASVQLHPELPPHLLPDTLGLSALAGGVQPGEIIRGEAVGSGIVQHCA